MHSTTDTKISWTRLRPGLYRAIHARPDLGLSISLEVERGDTDNTGYASNYGWWRFGAAAAGRPGSDSSSWDYSSMREAMAQAERFAREARLDPRWGLVY